MVDIEWKRNISHIIKEKLEKTWWLSGFEDSGGEKGI